MAGGGETPARTLGKSEPLVGLRIRSLQQSIGHTQWRPCFTLTGCVFFNQEILTTCLLPY